MRINYNPPPLFREPRLKRERDVWGWIFAGSTFALFLWVFGRWYFG